MYENVRFLGLIDHLCHLSYISFRDVVTLNTTYQTNKYDLIYGAFMGVNHHDQTVLFGCGFFIT